MRRGIDQAQQYYRAYQSITSQRFRENLRRYIDSNPLAHARIAGKIQCDIWSRCQAVFCFQSFECFVSRNTVAFIMLFHGSGNLL